VDGKRLLAELRAMPSELALVPVLLITARAEEDEKVASLLLGAEGQSANERGRKSGAQEF
jgi:DNA-binding response OmpR family regulator